MQDSPVYLAPLSPDDMGQLLTASAPVPGEAFFTALVSKPEEVVGRLARRADWPAEEAEIVAGLPATKTRIPALVPGRFQGFNRKKAECLGRQVIGHDFDHVAGASFADAAAFVRAALPDRFLAIHTTSTERNPPDPSGARTWRLRAYELLDREATPEEWERKVKPHMRSVGEHDPNALDITRLLYAPVRTAGYRWMVLQGPRTRLDDLVENKEPEARSPGLVADRHNGELTGQARSQTYGADAAPSNVARLAAAASALGAAWPSSGRHRAQLALAGALKRAGWSKDDALEFLCAVCRAAGDEDRPKRQATIDHTWETDTITGWPTLEGLVDRGVVRAAQALIDPFADDLEELDRVFSARIDAPSIALAPVESHVNAPPDAAPSIAPSEDEYPVRWGGWDQPVPPPVYLLDGLIPEAKVVTVFAEGGSVKTWAMLALCIAVATGDPWLDAHPVKRGKALFLDWEDGPHEFARRVKMLTGGVDVPDLGYLYGGPQIDKVEFWTKLGRFCQRHTVRLVVVDSLNASMPSDADENDPRFSAGMKLAGRFTEIGTTVVFVHHANKAGGIRGSSTIRDQSDVVFKFLPVSEKDDGTKRMRMECDKPGPQKKPAPVNIELSDNGLGTFRDDAAEVGRNASSDKDVRAAILLALQSGPLPTKHKVRDAVKCALPKVKSELEALEATGEVVMLDGVGYTLDDDQRRRARVLEQLARPALFRSCADLAKAASVRTAFVEDMVRLGLVAGEKQGRLFAVDRAEG